MGFSKCVTLGFWYMWKSHLGKIAIMVYFRHGEIHTLKTCSHRCEVQTKDTTWPHPWKSVQVSLFLHTIPLFFLFMGSQISNVSQVWPGMVSIPHSPIATRGHSSGHTDGIVTEDRPVEPSGARGLQWVNPTGLHPWSHWGASASRTSRIQRQQCSGTCWSSFLWMFFWV